MNAFRGRVSLAVTLVLAMATGCHKQRFEKVPGETDIRPTSVKIESDEGGKLHVDDEALFGRLGIRPASVVNSARYYNPARLPEDRRRIQAHWQTAGYFDAEVAEPDVQIDEQLHTVKLRWTVHEGPRYELANVEIRHAPDGLRSELEDEIPSRPGRRFDLEVMRVARYRMAEILQRNGHAHARVYTRFFVDRAAKKVHASYLVDAGPITHVGTLRVDGNVHVKAEHIVARTGLTAGAPIDLALRDKAENDLRDTGAFASAVIEMPADVETYIGDVPDSGGVLDESQIDANGDLVPRKLADTLDLVIHVREAPTVQLRVRGSFEVDSTRLDAIAGAGVTVRNFIGSQHHLTVDGRIGHGTLWRGDTDDPTGFYGDALIRTHHPGLLGRIVDARMSGRYRDVLYPGFHLREITVGPGLRSTPITGLFLDVDALFRVGQQVGLGTFDEPTRRALALPSTNDSRGAELDASIVRDTRNDPAEPMSGYLLALRGAWSPGGPLGTHKYLQLLPEGRLLVPLSESWSLGFRAAAGWVALRGDEGVPLGPRLFGGGAFGMRGFGRDRLSPSATACHDATHCGAEVVGGLSLAQGTVELRMLTPLKQYGLVTFVDAGGAGRRANPFDDGVSMAFGLGPRLRLWYFPISIDAAYRFLDTGTTRSPSFTDTLLFFLRIGEAF